MSPKGPGGSTYEAGIRSEPGTRRTKMLSLTGKNMVVIGGSRGVGRRIVEAGIRNGAHVLAVARQESALRQLAQEVPGTEVLSLDTTDEAAPSKVFDVLEPDILVLCGARFRLHRRCT